MSVGAQTTTDEQQQQAQPKTKTTKTEENVSPARRNKPFSLLNALKHGREMHESLALHRGFRERSDVHFSIGTHPRDWWLRTYSIVVMDGCHYYLADNGCWYPAYGFDPSCSFPDGVVYCE